ncbi:MAG: hypothetical protein AB1730_22660 [Myxococcota bacterium]|jgi:hydrogenase-4 membrane subunit HyfE
MSTLLVALLGVMLLPLFLGKWRMSLFGLACQGLLLGWLAVEGHAEPPDAEGWLRLVDLVVVRGLLAPGLLYVVMRSRDSAARHDVIPPNLLSWTLAGALVLGAFTFAEGLVPEAGDARLQAGVATAGLLLAFFVLGSQSSTFGQMVGALRFENALALFELGAPEPEQPIWLRAGLLVVFLVTVGFLVHYLETLGPETPPTAPTDAPEGPTL